MKIDCPVTFSGIFLVLVLKIIDIKLTVEFDFTAQNTLPFYPNFVKVFNCIFTLIHFPTLFSVHFKQFHYIR